MMKKNLETEVKVGIFVALGLALTMGAIIILGSTQNLLVKQNDYVVHFPTVEGLIPGAKVVVGGIQVGTVKEIDYDPAGHNVKVDLEVARKYAEWIRQGSVAEIQTQGMLGDKYVVITSGSSQEPILKSGSELPTRSSESLAQFISRGDQLMVSLNSIAKSLDRMFKGFESEGRSEKFFEGMSVTARNLSLASEKLNRELDGIQLRAAVKNLRSIFEKIDNGTGTLGALVNDPALYDDAKALMGGANRNRIIRNLVRETIKKSEEKK